MSTITKVFQSGNSTAVRLPKGYALPCGEIRIRKIGKALILEPTASTDFPDDFWAIAGSIPDLHRPPQTTTKEAALP